MYLFHLTGTYNLFQRNEVKQMQRQLGKKEKAILDYGDSYFFNAVIEPLPIYGAMKKVFGTLAMPYPRLGTLATPLSAAWQFIRHFYGACVAPGRRL